MSYTNRHEYFISCLDTELDKITGLNILTEFSLDKWNDETFPYAHVELAPEKLSYSYEDFNDFEGEQEFVIWVGVDTSFDGNMRNAYGALVLKIEKQFKKFSIASLNTSDFDLYISKARITGINPVLNVGETKYLFIVSGTIKYRLDWN